MTLAIIVPVVLGIGLAVTGVLLEKRDFNNGFCRDCNYVTWVSWLSVDKNNKSW